MDFAFTEEQEMLRASARDWLSRTLPPDRVARLADADPGWDPETWGQIAELGWLGISLPHSQGGGEMSFIEEAVLLEEAGRALYAGPLFSTVALALPVLAEAGHPVVADIVRGRRSATLAWAETEQDRLDSRVRLECEATPRDGVAGSGAPVSGNGPASTAGTASGTGNGAGGTLSAASWDLTGRKLFVPDLAIATDAVVIAAVDGRPALFRVDLSAHPDVVVPRSTMDSTRRLGELALSGTPADLLLDAGATERLLPRLRLRALAAAACEAAGVAQRALEMARTHASERQQFSRPIGSYQAISHRVANVYVAVELARSLAYRAAWCVAEQDPAAELACAEAKAAAAEAAVFACESAIQVHGGMGFTWEQPVHRWYKRAQWLDAFEGFAREHRGVVAAALLDG